MSEWRHYDGDSEIAPQYEPPKPIREPKPARVLWAWLPTLCALVSIIGVFGPWPDSLPRAAFGWAWAVLMLFPLVMWGVAAITGVRLMALQQESYFVDPDQPLLATARITLVLGIGSMILVALFWIGADSYDKWGLWLVSLGAIGVLVTGGIVGRTLGIRTDLAHLEAQQAYLSQQIKARKLR